MRFAITDHALDRYVARCAPRLSLTEARERLEEEACHAVALRTLSAGGQLQWRIASAVLVTKDDHGRRGEHVVVTVLSLDVLGEEQPDVQPRRATTAVAAVFSDAAPALPEWRRPESVDLALLMRATLADVVRKLELGLAHHVLTEERRAEWREVLGRARAQLGEVTNFLAAEARRRVEARIAAHAQKGRRTP